MSGVPAKLERTVHGNTHSPNTHCQCRCLQDHALILELDRRTHKPHWNLVVITVIWDENWPRKEACRTESRQVPDTWASSCQSFILSQWSYPWHWFPSSDGWRQAWVLQPGSSLEPQCPESLQELGVVHLADQPQGGLQHPAPLEVHWLHMTQSAESLWPVWSDWRAPTEMLSL